MTRIPVFLLTGFLFAGSLVAADWDPNDDTFDPSLQSVVIGNRSWLGDPSPFVHQGSSRTGYTHVNAAHYEGFDASVVISLMVPLEPGETKPAGGGMLMLNESQTQKAIESLTAMLNADKAEAAKPVEVETALQGATWKLIPKTESDKRFIDLENETKESTHTYRFSINACKKLLGAIKHSQKSLAEKAEK